MKRGKGGGKSFLTAVEMRGHSVKMGEEGRTIVWKVHVLWPRRKPPLPPENASSPGGGRRGTVFASSFPMYLRGGGGEESSP